MSTRKRTAQAQPTASPWLPSPGRAQQRERKRQAVLHTAARLFNERGFHATSLDDIAERLHVSKPTLYYYIKSKDDILLECVGNSLDMMKSGIAEVREGGGRALDQLIACMRIYAEIVTQDFGKCVIRIGEDPLPEPQKKALRKLKAGIDHEFRRLIDEGIREGSLKPSDPKLTAFMLAGALSWIGRWYREDGDMTPEQVIEQGIAVLLGGVLSAPHASTSLAKAAKPAARKTAGTAAKASAKPVVKTAPKTPAKARPKATAKAPTPAVAAPRPRRPRNQET